MKKIMAKSKAKSDAILNQYLELNKKISSTMKNGKNGVDIFKKFGEITEYIDTGSYIINAQFSGSIYGGIPNARSVEIAGSPQTGKTFFVMNIIRGAQSMGYFCYYIDTEGAVDPSDFPKFGIDPKYVQIVKTLKTFNSVKFFINTITQFKKEQPDLKILIALDSFGMLNTEASISNAMKGKYAEDMGKRAKEGREMFRTFTLDLSNMQIPFVFTNHTGANLDLFSQDKEKTSGGDGPTYAASIIAMLGKKVIKSEDDKKALFTDSGIIVRTKTDKNRLSRPLEKYTVISPTHGMNRFIGLEEYLSWELCGVDRGTIYDEEQFKKKFKNKPPENSAGKKLDTFDWEINKAKFYFVRNPRAKTYGVQDTLRNVQTNALFTQSVFSDGALKRIDAYIKEEFKYKDFNEQLELQGLAELANLKEEKEEGMQLTN